MRISVQLEQVAPHRSLPCTRKSAPYLLEHIMAKPDTEGTSHYYPILIPYRLDASCRVRATSASLTSLPPLPPLSLYLPRPPSSKLNALLLPLDSNCLVLHWNLLMTMLARIRRNVPRLLLLLVFESTVRELSSPISRFVLEIMSSRGYGTH